MKQFKKRTLALVLASAITVVGAFGAENYKNSLMALKFNTEPNGSVNATLYTKNQVTNNISPIRKGINTYIVMLPETNSEIPSEVKLGVNIESVDIQTMPYTNTNNGYTKITIKTKNNAHLSIETALYIAQNSDTPELLESSGENESEETPEQSEEPESRSASNTTTTTVQHDTIHSSNGVSQTAPVDINESLKQFQSSEQQTPVRKKRTTVKRAKSLDELDEKPTHKTDILYTLLGAALVVAISIFLMLKARDKMIEVTGERANYDVSDDPKPGSKKKEKPKINTTINNLDKRYTRPVSMPVHPADKLIPGPEPEEPVKQEVENVVDLDELLNEQAPKPEPPVNEALEDFLSSFSFDDEEKEAEETDSPEEQSEKEEEEKEEIREELYNKYINDQNMEFSKDDVEKIETLMNSEISDDAMRNASEFMDSSEKDKKPSPLEVLEKLITTYTVEQNITFTEEDVKALYKLINVEIDSDFINDLRTNPSRMQEMQDEIARQKSKPHKTSELLTLNVKDMLPDLSEALKQQGGRRIESEVKPQVVYASEGYEVSTLKLNMDLPDLSKEINNKDAYKSRPSDDIMYVDTNYEVQKMSIANELPDLKDVMLHPEKYETPEPEEVKVDEEALLKNIANVTFKPFDDGTREFEILNDIPTVSDMQEEFNQFGEGFEIINNDDDVPEVKETEQNDFETLYDGKYVDFDKEITEELPVEEQTPAQDENNSPLSALPKLSVNLTAGSGEAAANTDKAAPQPEIKPVNSEHKPAEEQVKANADKENEADKLLNQIKVLEQQRRAKAEARKAAVKVTAQVNSPEFCILEGVKYNIINTSNFIENAGCYLTKHQDVYCIIGFAGDKIFKLKEYKELDNERLYSRISDKLDDGTSRYIVRAGGHKFIVNVKDDNMEFVMDLC